MPQVWQRDEIGGIELITYKEDTIWPQCQQFLPQQNRLTEDILPSEYYINIDNANIHIDHYEVAKPKGRVVLFHGVGGNGRLLSFIAIPLWKAGFEIICPDMPLYGYTTYSNPIYYSTWINYGKKIVKHFQQDTTPLFLFGLSAGGMLAYQIACESIDIKGIMVTCILDQRELEINKKTSRTPIVATIGKPLMAATHKFFGKIKIPMRFIANMNAIANNQKLVKILTKDLKSSGVSVPLSFVYTLMTPHILIEPENFKNCPFLLVHPEYDHWTDVSLSKFFYDRLACPKVFTLLKEAGHFPIEPKGLGQMEKACLDFLNTCL